MVAVDGLGVDGDLDVAGVLAVSLQNFVLGVGVVSVTVLALLLDVLGVRVVHAVLELVRGMRLRNQTLSLTTIHSARNIISGVEI